MGKMEKEYIVTARLIALVASLKTLWRNFRKTHKREK
jgi:hypothetical protein